MKVLLTGGSGFLGKIIKSTLNQYQIITLARNRADIIADLKEVIVPLPVVDLVIHAAGKAHSVPNNNTESDDFYAVNVNGTLNLLKSLESSEQLPSAFIFISTVAVYGRETGTLINENEPLLANDPYGNSKIKAEGLITTWCKQHHVICTILRLPLIAGPNPPGNLGSMIKGINKGYYFNINGGKAKKSIVMVDDVARIIPIVYKIGGIYNLTDTCHPSFKQLSEVIATQLNKSHPRNIPYTLAKILAFFGDMIGNKAPLNSNKLQKIVSDLTFDDSKAKNILGWLPDSVLTKMKID